MEMKLFYKTQRELAIALNSLVDAYWEGKVNEETLINGIRNIYINNTPRIVKEKSFTTILKQQCGKRRLDVVEKILVMSGLINENHTAV